MFFSRAKAAHLRLGRAGENAAAQWVLDHGGTLLARNWRCRAGELDIVALDGETLVFIEVKTLRYHPDFRPSGNLSLRQRRRNARAAEVFCGSLEYPRLSKRFDLAEVLYRKGVLWRLTWHRGIEC